MTTQKTAILRVCARCEWVFRKQDEHPEMGGCPQCGFGSYGARYVYGNKAYQYEYSQKPWLDKKISAYMRELQKKIDKKKPRSDLLLFIK